MNRDQIPDSHSINRRHFIHRSSLMVAAAIGGGAAAGVSVWPQGDLFPRRIPLTSRLKGLREDTSGSPLEQGAWFVGETDGAGLQYEFPANFLSGAKYLTSDWLLDGKQLVVFRIRLQEGQDGPAFQFSFGLLNQCSARLRLPLAATDQNRWMFEREAALLKPLVGGQRVDPSRVDRITLTVFRKGPDPSRWCMTPLTAVEQEPQPLADPLLPKGALLDELGQSTLHGWEGKSTGRDEVTRRLRGQREAASRQKWPEGFSRWGGWKGLKFDESGFFRTHHDGKRWWIVDPEGYAFWSAGMDCVRVDTEAACAGLEKALQWIPGPGGEFKAAWGQGANPRRKSINYLAANFIRAFGSDSWYEAWSAVSLAELRRMRFNTVGNWSDWQIARKAGFPYVRPMRLTYSGTPMIYRDFPDVFHPDFKKDAESFGAQLQDTATDPSFLGYFMMNEPTWGFAGETPAAGMLFNSPRCESRKALASYLRQRYSGDSSLSDAWGPLASFQSVAEGEWKTPLTTRAKTDLADFSAVMTKKFFSELSEACRRSDPHHLNLGIRYHTVPPSWALEGMRSFDVFSMNCYESRVRAAEMEKVNALLNRPVLVGEWHFGALDAGLPATGIGAVRDQAARGRAFRVYTEDAAAKPWCVGVHYFTLYDQSALGRFDGENYNIGFLDVCNRPYEALAEAARASHERIYPVAKGEAAPFSDPPEYLPKLFL
jgi:hypothetical protein